MPTANPDQASPAQAIDLPIWTKQHATAVEAHCTELLPNAILMEHAALAIRDVARELLTVNPCQLVKIVVIVGKGNNAGDALAAARLLADYQPDILLTNAAPTSPLAIAQLYAARKLGLAPELYDSSAGLQRKYLGKQLLIIDGIVGLGLTGKLTPALRALVTEINQYSRKQVIAIDLPSGLRCDYAAVDDDAVKADITITFGGKKPAHVLPPAQDYCGEVRVAPIFPVTCVAETFAKIPSPLFISGEQCRTPLPASAHKYRRGHVLVIGGSKGKCGAPLLAGMAALRTGAGLVSVALAAATDYSLPLDLLYEDFFKSGTLDLKVLADYVEHRQVRAIVIGCGCVTNPIDAQVWKYLVQFARQKGAVVVDAGALKNLFALGAGTENIILTPHGGEWNSLVAAAEAVEAPWPTPNSVDTIAEVKNIAVKQGMTLVYKNSSPLIFSPQRQRPVYVCEGGDNSLAKAGTGDIYAGIVAALTLVTDGWQVTNSWQAAVSAHRYLRQAADKATMKVGKHGITASLLLENLTGD